MRVFVTGATGFVGAAVVKELIGAGHEVLGLSRSDVGDKGLIAAGAKPFRGDLEDLNSLTEGAKLADGVVHAGFNHDFSRFKESCEHDRRVIDSLGQAFAGSLRPIVITSGIGLLPAKVLVTEATRPLVPGVNPRIATEEAARTLMEKNLNVSLMRLPPTVHGPGDHGFIPMLINVAREKRKSVYTTSGDNLWPAVHRDDAAKLYRLALEKAASGATYHAVAESGVPFKKIAEAIGEGLNVPVVSLSKEESAEHFGWFAHFAAMDIKASSQLTQDSLGWKATHPDLLTDLKNAGYF